MSSFYGGKQGRTYNLVKRYDTVDAMVQAFHGGGAYTEVNYGEYVIIDTVLSSGRSNIENGLLYRRGFDYNADPSFTKPDQSSFIDESTGYFDKQSFSQAWKKWVQDPGAGAIYVGQIVGPEGGSPKIEIQQWSDFETQLGSTAFLNDGNSIILDRKPGKQDNNGVINFNDVIQAGYVNIRDNHGDIVGGYIAFDIPQTVLETELVDTDPYMAAATAYENPASTAHPFYYKWDFKIPAGKHGQDVYQMVKETGKDIEYSLTKDNSIQNGKTYYTKSGNNYIIVTNPVIDDISTYYEKNNIISDGEGKTIVNTDQYITYSIKDYEESAAGAVTAHFGRWPYRVIDRINTNYKQRIFFNWSTSSGSSSITSAQVGSIYNTGQQDQNNNLICLVCIKEGDVDLNNPPTGPFTIGQQIEAPEVVSGYPSKWRVIILPRQAPANSAIVYYKAGEPNTINLMRNLDYIMMDQNGNMFAYYSDSNQPFYLMTSRTLGEVYYDSERGQIVVTYNGEEEEKRWGLLRITDITYQDSILNITCVQNGQTQVLSFSVPKLQSIDFRNENNILEAQRFSYTFEGGETNYLSENLNFPLAFKRYGDSLLVLYSDPAVRANIPQDKVYISDWTDPNPSHNVNGQPKTYTNLRWYNFGPIGSQFHVQGDYTLEDLKTTYKNGLGNDELTRNRQGWLVTINYTQNDSDRKAIFAYDYVDDPQNPSHELPDGTPSCWYEIMSIDQAMASNPAFSILISEQDINHRPVEDDDKLQNNGIWFVVSGGHD